MSTPISAALVKELRERTGAGMMECKKALESVQGNIEAAIDALRAGGQAKAVKRAGKIASEGGIVVCVDDAQKVGCMVEINCETDFVARSEDFLGFASAVAQKALQERIQDIAALAALPIQAGGSTIDEARHALIAKIGENVQIRRAILLESDTCVGSYLHGQRIGVLVAINRHDPEFARELAMHIAAMNPQALDAGGLSAEIIQREREIFIAQSKESGKPADIIEKMVAGRIAKFLKEVCLLDQPFVKDADQTVGALLKARQTQITEFVRYETGEGIEKQTQDFAEEVKSQLKG